MTRSNFCKKIELSNLFELSTEPVTVCVGNTGAYALAAISGFADVDAMSMSRLEIGELGADVAARAILIVVAVNAFSKARLGCITGGFGIGRNLFATAAGAILDFFITAQR